MTTATNINETFVPSMPDPVEIAHLGADEAYVISQTCFQDSDAESHSLPRTMLVPAPGQLSTDPVLAQAREQLCARIAYGSMLVEKTGNRISREITAREIEIDRQEEQGVPIEARASKLCVVLMVDADTRALCLMLRDVDRGAELMDEAQYIIPQDAFTVPTELIDLLTPEQSADFMIRCKQIIQAQLNTMLAFLTNSHDVGIDGWFSNEFDLDPLHLMSVGELSLDLMASTLNVLQEHIATFEKEVDVFVQANPTADRAVLAEHPLAQSLRVEAQLQVEAIEYVKEMMGLPSEVPATATCCGQCGSCEKH